MTSKRGLILYVHGARDRRWAEPFERLRTIVAARAPDVSVAIAFLEHLAPDLAGAASILAAQGVDQIRVAPLFFGRGGHLREDFPRQLDAARAAAPTARFEVTEAAGENATVLEALARFVLEAPAIGFWGG